jgi:hypothetical protein
VRCRRKGRPDRPDGCWRRHPPVGQRVGSQWPGSTWPTTTRSQPPHDPRRDRLARSQSPGSRPARPVSLAASMTTLPRPFLPAGPLAPLPPFRPARHLVPRRSRLAEESWVPLVTWRPVPGQGSCPCATGPRPAGQLPRLGRLEIRLGPAWVRYRETATPETDPPSRSHRPVLVPGRPRARPSRLRVTLPRCRPSPWCPSTAMPIAPTYPARVRLRLPGSLFVAGAGVLARPRACSGIRPSAVRGPAVLYRVAG